MAVNGAVAATPPSGESSARVVYRTRLGVMYRGSAESFTESPSGRRYAGKVQLLLTSPPFPLNRKKRYGNLTGEAYLEWLAHLAPRFADLLAPDGSVVLEIGNAWNPDEPTMTPLTIESLLAFLKAGGFKLCQQFVAHNPARLPSPVEWVNKRRVRVKDSFTHIWWMAKSAHPKADNRRVLRPYSASMQRLLERGSYNDGRRPSGYVIGPSSFLTSHSGSIPANVLTYSNTASNDSYRRYCLEAGLPVHPARMARDVASFFVRLLTEPGDLVFDPFAGSNTTGATAEELQRRWLAVEPRPDYVDGSIGRFSNQAVRRVRR